MALREGSGKDILIGSRSLITELLKLGLIDELQLCIHPVVEGNGLPLFESITDRMMFDLGETKIFGNGAILLSYHPKRRA